MPKCNVFNPATGSIGLTFPQVGMLVHDAGHTGVIKNIANIGSLSGLVQLSHTNAWEYPYMVYVDFANVNASFNFGLNAGDRVYGSGTGRTTAH